MNLSYTSKTNTNKQKIVDLPTSYSISGLDLDEGIGAQQSALYNISRSANDYHSGIVKTILNFMLSNPILPND